MDETDFQSKLGAFGTINHLMELVSSVSSRFRMVLSHDSLFKSDQLTNQIEAIEKQISTMKLAIESSLQENQLENYS